jgi:hypothetical protein
VRIVDTCASSAATRFWDVATSASTLVSSLSTRSYSAPRSNDWLCSASIWLAIFCASLRLSSTDWPTPSA